MSGKKENRTDFVPVNLPRSLLDKLDVLLKDANDTGLIYIASRAEAVKRAVENYIVYLKSLLPQKVEKRLEKKD